MDLNERSPIRSMLRQTKQPENRRVRFDRTAFNVFELDCIRSVVATCKMSRYFWIFMFLRFG